MTKDDEIERLKAENSRLYADYEILIHDMVIELSKKGDEIERLREDKKRLHGLLKECQPYLAVRDTRGLWGKIIKEVGDEG